MTQPFTPVCTKCGLTATNQYSQTFLNGSVQAYWACAVHAYDPTSPAATGTHTAACSKFPCNCAPVQPPQGITAGPPVIPNVGPVTH